MEKSSILFGHIAQRLKLLLEKTPFELVYGMEEQFPINLQIPTLQISQHFTIDKEALQGRIDQLVELDETKRMDFNQMVKNQRKIKGTFDRKARQRDFKKGSLVLMWDKRREKPRMHQKFDSLWLGPYKIKENFGSDSFYFFTSEGRNMPFPVNNLSSNFIFQKELDLFRATSPK